MTETTKALYRVRGIELDHDGERYADGHEVVLTVEEAALLTQFVEPVIPHSADLEPSPASSSVADKGSSSPTSTNIAAVAATEAGSAVATSRGGRQAKATAETSNSSGATT